MMRTNHHGFPTVLLLAAALFGAAMPIGIVTAAASSPTLESLIARAGNADEDLERLAILKTMQSLPDLDEEVADDLKKLIAEIDRYIHSPNLPYFGGTTQRNRDYDFGLSEGSPLEPLTWLYRGRMLTWVTLESGGIWKHDDRRRAFLGKAREFFQKTVERFPKNEIAGMYLGRPIPPNRHYPPVAGAPAWAVHQRESLERLADIIEWWIDNRMQENGEYGGGWGDDCEMWRWWMPVLIGFDDPKITAAQERFSMALLSQPHMEKGYTTRMTDVEHTAEDSADAMTPMMHLVPDDPQWRDRALRLAELMQNLWTGRNQRDLLQFKSTYFTAERVDENPQRACDTVYHPRAVQPTLLYWQRTGDEDLSRLFSDWMDTWLDAAARAERGKPAGMLPTAIHWPDGRVGGLGEDWWDPRNHGEYTLYLFPSAMTMMTHTLLLTYHMTGEAKYLAPIRSMAKFRLQYLQKRPSNPEPGSAMWCAAQLGGMNSVLAKYRALTGSDEFDGLLRREQSPYLMFRWFGADDGEALATALRNTADALAINWPGYTSEVRYTDRVLRYPTLFDADRMFEEPVATIRRPEPDLLYSTITGDPGQGLYFPMNAVRWLTPPRDIAALVVRSDKKEFVAQLFHFGDQPREMEAELYLLEPGRYNWELWSGWDDKKLSEGQVEVAGPRTRVSFILPPQTLCTLGVQRTAER